MSFTSDNFWFAIVTATVQPVRQSALQTYVFTAVMILIVLWLGLLAWSFAWLRIHHSATYDKLGAPSLFWNNSNRSNSAFLGYLYSNDWRELEDPALTVVFWVMRFVFLGFVASLLMVLGLFFIHS